MEEGNNGAAPAATADNAAITTGSPDAAGNQGGVNNTTQNPPVPEVPAFDPRTSYDALVKQLESVNKSYGSLRSEFTRRTQHEADMRKQIETLTKAFAEATRQEISPEEFKKSLETQGIKAFDPLREQWQRELREEHDKALAERDQQISELQIGYAIMSRTANTQAYPDFAKLMPVMQEIAADENCPVDWNQNINVVYDTLYKLARDLKAEESVKKAHELGRKEADAQAQKESATAVAAGGKTNTTGLNTRDMTAAQLKQHFAKLGMVSD